MDAFESHSALILQAIAARTTQRSYRSSDFRRDIADGPQNGHRSEVRRQIIDWCRFD